MNRLSKIFLGIIIVLTIALTIMTYYYFYMRSGYISASTKLFEVVKSIEENNGSIPDLQEP